MKTPGVYIEEVPVRVPTVTAVETAVPVFIGPTRKHEQGIQSLRLVPTPVGSMREYYQWFGEAPNRRATVQLDALNNISSVSLAASGYLPDSLQLFFSNGGTQCYILSLGSYTDALTATDYLNALELLRSFDEPTLLVLPDCLSLTDVATAIVQQAAIDHCQAMKDRFAVLDVKTSSPTTAGIVEVDSSRFRSGVAGPLSYAAAYYPYLRTTLPLTIGFADLTVYANDGTPRRLEELLPPGVGTALITEIRHLLTDLSAARAFLPSVAHYEEAVTKQAKKTYLLALLATFASAAPFADAATQAVFDKYTKARIPLTDNFSKLQILRAAGKGLQTSGSHQAPLTSFAQLFQQISAYLNGFLVFIQERLKAKEEELKANVPLYAALVSAAEATHVVVPPSGAVVGVYARTDATLGVWKTPANAALHKELSPVVSLNSQDLETLNVDSSAGKSINAMRAFTGKGTLIWGARTLAGNDNEGRYIPVRRFFIMVEESVSKAAVPFTFEPNEAPMWTRLRSMVENFLIQQWRAGALAGGTPESAFFVRVGLNQTMTPEDILNGVLIVEIGMAPLRPAEFIVVRYRYQMYKPLT